MRFMNGGSASVVKASWLDAEDLGGRSALALAERHNFSQIAGARANESRHSQVVLLQHGVHEHERGQRMACPGSCVAICRQRRVQVRPRARQPISFSSTP
jgi:hypothetical protein